VGMIDGKRAEATLRASDEYLPALVQNALDVITILEADGTIRYKSPGIERELGYTADELIGTSVFALIHPDDLARTQGLFTELLDRARENVLTELRCRHKDGSYRWLEVIGTNLLAYPSVDGIVVNSRDITERKAFEARLVHQAHHDPLTHLPNRALFLEELAATLSLPGREADALVALLLLDLDSFKLVNDTRGHAAGDELLVAVGRRLRGCLPCGTTLARLGGDEFAVLLKRVADPAEPARLAGRLIEALQPPFTVEGHEVFVTAAVGVVTRHPRRTAPGSLLRDADTALYKAKAVGPDSYAIYDPRLRAALLARVERKMALHGAAERGELRLHYQPKVELTTGRTVAVEALLRWEHPDQGLLHAAEFIQLAEETGLIVTLGRWALREACRQAREWTDVSAERPSLVCVNLSVRQLREAGLVAEVARALEDACLDPGRLELEITEGAVMQKVPAVRRALRDLRKLGVLLAIDDFGSGFSSLARLRGLPADTLKIDRAFVAPLRRDAASLVIVRAIVALAHDLGLMVAAEGVETAEQAAMLRAVGTDLGQGFYFAPPLPGEAITDFLARDARLPEGRGVETGTGTGELSVETAQHELSRGGRGRAP